MVLRIGKFNPNEGAGFDFLKRSNRSFAAGSIKQQTMYFSQNQVCGEKRMLGINDRSKHTIGFVMVLVSSAE